MDSLMEHFSFVFQNVYLFHDTIANNIRFGRPDAPMEEGELVELKKALLEGASWHQPDHYFLLLDYESYMAAKLKAIRATKDRTAFGKLCLHNIAGAGKFSSDRTIEEYWNELWRKA